MVCVVEESVREEESVGTEKRQRKVGTSGSSHSLKDLLTLASL